MDITLEKQLLKIAEEHQTKTDPSHDFNHVLRVLSLAKQIGKHEGADLEVLVPAAIFHDIVVYRKDDPRNKYATDESATFAKNILTSNDSYPQDKIKLVAECIKQCSFSKGIEATTLESKVLQDADRLEATGAISIMRIFSSGGQMNRCFYNPENPFGKKSSAAPETNLDLFFDRLLVVEKRMHTQVAKRIAKKRTKFVHHYLRQLETELKESSVV